MKKRLLFSAMLVGVFLRAEPGIGASYVWTGAGRSGGTEDTAWLNAGNWLVDGVPAETPPGADDDATVTLNTAYDNPSNPNVAVEIGAGATARHVVFGGMNVTGRKAEIQGDVTFATLDYNTASMTLTIVAGATLTLSGGEINPTTDAVIRYTFRSPPAYSGGLYRILEFPGKIRCTGSQVPLALAGVLGDIYVDNPAATVHFNNGTVVMGGDLYVFSTQRVIGFNPATGLKQCRQNRFLMSQDGASLTNWAACNIAGPGGLAMDNKPLKYPAGTYRSIDATYTIDNYVSDMSWAITGDVCLSGTNASGYALRVLRQTTRSAESKFDLLGNRLRIVGGGPLAIGDSSAYGVTARSFIVAAGATVSVDGPIVLGPGGYFSGDSETTIALKGNWDNRSRWQTNNFTLAASTLVLDGVATPSAPQRMEAQSLDLGPTPAGMVKNHGIGRLEVGTLGQPTHVRLVDSDDFMSDGTADAFYAGELIVHAGSSLDICGLNLYVDGQSVRRRWLEFGPGRVYDSTIPHGLLITIR